MPVVMIIEGSQQYRAMFEKHGWEITTDFTKADLIQFTGGADVSPFLYGEGLHPTTHHDPRRDLVEAGYFAFAVRLGIPMAGICRGGQFLNVMNGGTMYQDVDGHAIHGTHTCYDLATDREIQVTSTHHQMMRISAKDATPVAVANISTRKEFIQDGEVVDGVIGTDLEAVFYEKTKSLCFQPHPEFYGADSTCAYYFELLERHLGFARA